MLLIVTRRTHPTQQQDSSQLQKHQAARMSRRIAVDQRRYAAGMVDTQVNSLRLGKLHKNWECS